jgi:hypothetical protein
VRPRDPRLTGHNNYGSVTVLKPFVKLSLGEAVVRTQWHGAPVEASAAADVAFAQPLLIPME